MRSRESIIRILAALRAKFAEGSGCTVEEAAAAVEQYNKLMQDYNIQETDVHIREEGIGKQSFRTADQGKQKPDWYYILTTVGKLSDTRIRWNLTTKQAHIYGTQADRDYAEFLLRVITETLESAWKTYRFSWDYTLQAKHHHGRHIRNTFRKALILRLKQRMDELIFMNRGTGTSLILVKNELIQAFMDNEGHKIKKGTKVTLRSNLDSTIHHAFEAANKAQLQYQTNNQTRLLEHNCDHQSTTARD